MDTEKAKKIIATLADGVNPFTGEVLSSQSPFNNPETIRALFHALEGVKVIEERERKKGVSPSNAGMPWSQEEDQLLASEFDAGKKVNDLAKAHGRSRYAIETRLVRLGKIDPKTITTRR
ncbi:MAG: hypothetical protein ACLP05_13840 [Candidatus Kryptoniota bacterium]